MLLASTVLVFAPAQVYCGNSAEFIPSLREFLPGLLVAAALAAAMVIGAVLLLPSTRARDAGVAMVFGLGLAAWIQGSFLLWPYGVLDGRAIDWAAHRQHALIDAGVWCLVLAVTVAASRMVRPVTTTASIALIAVQAGAVAIQASQVPDRWIDHMRFDQSKRYSFSPDRNAIVLLLDTFQSDLFQQLLDEDRTLPDRFRGFTYFRNATAGFSGTPASVPLILTGRYYDNSVPFGQFVKTTFLTNSLPKALKDAGFHVYYDSPTWPSLYADESISSHAKALSAVWDWRATWLEWRKLTTLGLFRCLPQPAKRLVRLPQSIPMAEREARRWYAQTGDREARRRAETRVPWDAGDAMFFRFAALLASADMPSPTFKYYHLAGIHPPLTHDEHFLRQDFPFTRENALRQARGVLRLVETFFETLSDTGVYDRTLIFIVGDHGTTFVPRLREIDPAMRARPLGSAMPTSNSFGLPLVLLKPLAATRPLSISDAPVSLADIPRTVTSLLDIPATLPGTSMSDTPLDARRQRRVFTYRSGEHRFTHQYFPPLTEYMVSGYSWLDESWQRTGRQFHPGEMRPLPASGRYTWGTPLRLGRGGNAEPYLADGWAAPEEGFRWTSGRSAHVQLTITQPGSDVVFRAQVLPALIAGLKRQRVEIFVANQQVGEWSVANAGEYSAVIPSQLAKEGQMEVVLALPDAVEPKTTDAGSPDERMLALAVSGIVLDAIGALAIAPAPAVELGRMIPLGLQREGLRYLGDGWSPPEEGLTWTNGRAARIRFQTPKPVSDLVVSLSVTPFVVPDRLSTPTRGDFRRRPPSGPLERLAAGRLRLPAQEGVAGDAHD